MSERTVRIFISSPGDVQSERKKAEQVIEDLQRDYREGIHLKPILWQNLALPATASFQETIELILGQEPIDVAVFILWARLGTPIGPRVTRSNGTPYRGLQVFDQEHAEIFFGRENETRKLVQRIREQMARAGQTGGQSDELARTDNAICAFVLIVGASGSGKSSLARAGVASWLRRSTYDEHTWKTVTFVPGLNRGQASRPDVNPLCLGLVTGLSQAVPELKLTREDELHLAQGLAKDPALTLKVGLTPRLAAANQEFDDSGTNAPEADSVPPASGETSGGLRVLLVLDQLEELWNAQQITDAMREEFLSAIEMLTQTGWIVAIATLRSDFYPQAQTSLQKLKGEHGHFDLLPPDAVSLQRIISQPARRSGLRFERKTDSEHTLDEELIDEAVRDRTPLPLLEYALDELDRQREPDSRMLTFAAYEGLGGLKRAGEPCRHGLR